MPAMKATLRIARDFAIGAIDPRLYGSFIEHLGRAVYGGIYEPGHPRADADGDRLDTLELVRELDVPIVRYPGGNFVSAFRWEDSVGPVESRPARLDLAWRALETNRFGLHEFVRWCRKAHTAPMMAVNLGTRGPEDALRLLEYCNHPGGTELSDWRRRNGAAEPFNIRTWCLGNEMDGPWQSGHKTPQEYARIACETARLLKQYDRTVETVACGSSYREIPTFGTWESTVLDEGFDVIDLLSLHAYYGKYGTDTDTFLSSSETMDDFIREALATADAVAAKRHSRKRIHLSFDEWNVWDQTAAPGVPGRDWEAGKPLLEQRYTLEDALVVGGMLVTLLNHADRIRIACLAQLVNVIAPISTRNGGGAWRQSIFHPFRIASAWGRGTALQCLVDTPRYDCKGREGVPVLSAAATQAEDDRLSLFLFNRSADALPVDIGLLGFGAFAGLEGQTLCGPDLAAVNTETAPGAIAPRALSPDEVQLDGASLHARLPARSWTALRLNPLP